VIARELQSFLRDYPDSKSVFKSVFKTRTASQGLKKSDVIHLAYKIPKLRSYLIPQIVKTAYFQESEFVKEFEGQRFKIDGVERAWSTILNYQSDPDSPFHNSAKKLVNQLHSKWYGAQSAEVTVDLLSSPAKTLKKRFREIKSNSQEFLKSVSSTVKKELEAPLLDVADKLASKTFENSGPVKGAKFMFNAVFDVIDMHQNIARGAAQKYIDMATEKDKSISIKTKDGLVSGSAMAKKAALKTCQGLFKGIKTITEVQAWIVNKPMKPITATMAVGFATLGAVVGTMGAVAGGSAKVVTSGLKKLRSRDTKGKTASENGNLLIDMFGDFFAHIDGESIEALLPYVKEDGSFDSGRFESDLTSQMKGKDFKSKIIEILEEHFGDMPNKKDDEVSEDAGSEEEEKSRKTSKKAHLYSSSLRYL
jgi:hypothetical protein